MTRTYSERHGARFLDYMKEHFEYVLNPSDGAKNGDEVTLALDAEGFDFDRVRDDWDIDVGDVYSHSSTIYVTVTVNGAADGGDA